MTLSAHRIRIEYRRENIDSMIYQMENLEMEKVKANSNVCRAQNNLLFLTEGHELPSRKEILDALGSLDKWSESAIKILPTLSDLSTGKEPHDRRGDGKTGRGLFEG